MNVGTIGIINMKQIEEEFQFFKTNKKAEKSTAYMLLVPLLAFIVNLILTFSIISYFNPSQPINNGVQIKIVHLNNQPTNQLYGMDYHKMYQHVKETELKNTSKDSNIHLDSLNNKNPYSPTFTPEEIAQINQYFSPKKYNK